MFDVILTAANKDQLINLDRQRGRLLIDNSCMAVPSGGFCGEIANSLREAGRGNWK